MKLKKDLILVIALLALVSLTIVPATAETFTDNVYYNSVGAIQSPVYDHAAWYPVTSPWYSADNTNLPNLRYIFWRSISFQNDTEMPIDSASYFDTIRFYKLSDGAKSNPIAEGVLSIRWDGGTPVYRAVGLYLSTPFKSSDLTGATESFNVSFSGNSTFYGLKSDAVRNSPTPTEQPFGLWTYQGSAGYTYHDYSTYIDWTLNVSDSYGNYPIVETLTANAETSGVNLYTYFPNGTLYDYKPTLLNTTIFSHNINPFIIKINQTATPLFNFEKTYTFFGGTLPGALTGTHNITFHVKDSAATNIYHAHISFSPTGDVMDYSSPTLTGYTDAAGLLTFHNASAGAAASVVVTATGFPMYVEMFSFTSDMTKEISLSPLTVNLYVNIQDSYTGYYLSDTGVGIQNATSGTWRNSTQSTGTIYFDSTGANYEFPLSINQTVIVAASKAGYRPASQTVTIPYDKYTITLLLANLNATIPSSGNFTAIIAVHSVTTGREIPGASVNIQELGRMAASNQGGAATFRNLPVGTHTLSISAAGYQPAIDSITGTDQETAMKLINLIPSGCSRSETGTISCNGTVVIPGGGSIGTGTANQTPNEKAAGGVTAFLDNIIGIGMLVLLLILFWFVKKIFLS
jgi:hypothetical protein